MEKNIGNKEKKIKQLYEKLAISWLIFIIFLYWISFYIYPQISLINTKKEELVSKIEDYEKLKQNWLTYTEFASISEDEILKKALGDNLKKFFEENLSNTGKLDYTSFLLEKEKYIDEINKSDIIKKRDEKISKVLPSYTEWFAVDWNMTDLAFVNYIESLLRTFGLQTSSKIWIEKIVVVSGENKENDKTKKISFNNELFYIPLTLELIWRKSDIVEFLYFLQNVWNVENVTKENITFYKDNLITRIILWQKRTIDYNIYENKLVDIENIEFYDYIDNSSSIRVWTQKTTAGFLAFIKNWPEKDVSYKIKLWLRFYVRWLPTYKIELFAEETVSKYKDLSKKVKALLQKSQNRKTLLLNNNIVEIISALKTIDNYLVEMEQRVKKLENSIKQKIDLSNIYKEASSVRYDIQNLEDYVSSLNIGENLK